MKATASRTQQALARRLAEVAWAVPQVVIHRTSRMAISAHRANHAMLSVLNAGFAPVHRRAVANARRLAR